jgi:OOP family OmpA-OmpF porin
MRLRNVILTLIVIGALNHLCKAQNLVPNGSFEEYTGCPGNFSESLNEFRVKQWHPATLGTPDHFHSCSTGEADVPHNWAGVSEAYHGSGFAGIYLWMEGNNPYREYLQCQLLQPLIKDSTYRIEFRYKLSSYSKFSIDRIGLLLTDSIINARHDNVLKLTPTLSVISDSALTVTTGLWEAASLRYKALGGEKFLTIGNFFDNESTRFYKILSRPIAQDMLAKSAYYYIDDVQVLSLYPPVEMSTDLLPEFSLKDTRLNTTYVLKNILFELNSYRLVPPSFGDLDMVADYLLRNPKVIVQLIGHTDDQGSEKYNLKLSRDRAKNAGAYLISVGIDPGRIEVFGYGKSRPLIKSTSEEARSINRRVEVKFIQ